MIITCEKCETRFKLDDARISADGVKVRCSRCKHAFRVARPQPPGASDADVADALAREAVVPEPVADEQTQVLGPSDEQEDHTQVLDHDAVDLMGSARSADEPDEESDWEFNEDPAEAAAEPARVADSQVEAPIEMAASPPPVESVHAAPDADPMSEFLASEPGAGAAAGDGSLADLGSPEDWDLLGPDVGPAATSEAAASLDAEPEPEAELADADEATGSPLETETETEIETETEAEAEVASSTPHDTLPEAGVAELRLDVGPPSLAARATQIVAWAAVAGLLLVVAWASLRPPVPQSMSLTVADLGVLQATEVRAGVIENAVAGPLLVVSGKVRNPQAGPRLPEGALRVRLVDGSGAVLAGAEAWLAPAPGAATLREQAPQELLGAQALGAQALARTPLAPGESMPVAAVFTSIPAEARGFRLEVVERLSSEASRPSPRPASE
ncbi:MAG: zinc-ribbon domain-containing protein [Deltaproteobacteria bacterium]|nr:zinc-ribbon domain-containing protein [Deltaproteobacteria bacterium]